MLSTPAITRRHLEAMQDASRCRMVSATRCTDGLPCLSGRSQFVRCRSSLTLLIDILFGAPQGSVMGPILFYTVYSRQAQSSWDARVAATSLRYNTQTVWNGTASEHLWRRAMDAVQTDREVRGGDQCLLVDSNTEVNLRVAYAFYIHKL